MIFEHDILPAVLQNHLEAVFYFNNVPIPAVVERVVPTGHAFLIFEFDGQIRHTFDNKTLQPNASFTKAWISGLHRNYLSISAHEQCEMFVMQFKAGGLHPFLHNSVDSLTGQILAAETVFGADVLSLHSNIAGATTITEKFKAAEDWLNKRFDETKTTPTEVVTMIEALQQQPAANFKDIIKSYPNTPKHLISQFRKYVGLTPKYYQRILRFNDILQRIHQKEKIFWADIAYSCGFADQSHFIKEFRHFCGFNPQEFIEHNLHKQETNFFPVEQ